VLPPGKLTPNPTTSPEGGPMPIWVWILIIILIVLALGGFGYSRR
jgi:hypothetical protein